MSGLTIARKQLMVPGPSGAFDPLNDVAWFDAAWVEDPGWTPPADTGNITSLNGNGTDATDWTVSSPSIHCQYQVAATSASGHDAWVFSGNASSADKTPLATFGSTLTGTVSVVLISYPHDEIIGYHCTSGGGTAFILSGDTSGASADWRFYVGGNNVPSTPSIDVVANTEVLLVGVQNHSGTEDKLYVDGTEQTRTNATSDSLPSLRIGSSNAGTVDYDGDMFFVGVYDGNVLNDSGWADFETWASDKYGMTIT